MIKVKCVYTGNGYSTPEELTGGKVYDAIEYDENSNSVSIIDDLGEIAVYYIIVLGRIWFVDVTCEYRSNVINEILS